MRRPAEKGGLAFAAAALIARAAGVDDVDVITAMAVVGSSVPYAVTLLVANGGILGTLRRLWRGKPSA